MSAYYEIYWDKSKNDGWFKNYEASFDINGVYERVELDTIWNESRGSVYIFRAIEKALFDKPLLPPPL